MGIIKINKKVMALLAVMLMSIGLLNGCGQSNVIKDKNGIYTNKEYADKDMVNIDGSKNKYDEEKSLMLKGMGAGVDLTDHINGLIEKGAFGYEENEEYYCKFIFYAEAMKDLIGTGKESTTTEEEEEMNKKVDQLTFNFAEVIRIPKDNKILMEDMKKNYSEIETLATLNGDTYYFAYNTDYSKLTLSDNDKADVKKLIDEIEALKKGICIYPPVENADADEKSDEKSNENTNSNINAFNAKTLDGKDITEDSFKNYDITMINIWSTQCGPCKEEMKDLAKLYDSLPKNINMITICTDAKDQPDLAQKIIDSANGKFKVVIPDDKLKESLLDSIDALPTTVFVDKDGNFVGKPIVGVPGKDAEAAYMNEINKRLESIGK